MSTKPETAVELPPLPEGKAVVRGPVAAFKDPECGTLVDFDCEGPLSHCPEDGEELFTADQMQDYARAALLAADGKAGGEVAAHLWWLGNKRFTQWHAADESHLPWKSVPLYTRPQPAAQVAQPLTEERVERMVEAYTRYQIRVDRGYAQQEEGMRLALVAGGFISADTKIIDAETEAH